MPLIDLKTKLKDLKFGTYAPYIQKDINNPGPSSAGEIQARSEDLSRLVKMFNDAPGAVFTAKQVALEASKADNLQSIFQASTVTNPALRIGNILLQVPVNRTGTHFLALDGGPLTNYYTRNNNAASEALTGGTIRVGNRSDIIDTPSEFDRDIAFYRRSSRENITRLSNEAKTNGKVTLGVSPKLVDTKTSDAINLLDVGGKTDSDLLVGVTFNKFGSPSSTLLTFRGFVQSIQDNFTGNWQSVNYVGRMEQFFTYTGFTRTFSFQLVIPIFSRDEQPYVFNKINSLVSYTAPTYNGKLPQGNIAYMTIGDYLRTPGIINSVNISVRDDVPWSNSKPGAYGSQKTRVLPQVITANISFTPIHTKAPQFYSSPFTKSSPNLPFIDQGDQDLEREFTLPDLEFEDTQLEEVDNPLDALFDQFSDQVSGVDLGNLFRRIRGRSGGLTPSIEVEPGFFTDIDDEFFSI